MFSVFLIYVLYKLDFLFLFFFGKNEKKTKNNYYVNIYYAYKEKKKKNNVYTIKNATNINTHQTHILSLSLSLHLQFRNIV